MHASTCLIMDRHMCSKVARVVADSLTGIHTAMVKWHFIVNRICIHKFLGAPQVKIQRIQIW
jgi:hypothetical protein